MMFFLCINHKNIKPHKCFTEMFLEQQINIRMISVTLKTGVMMLKILLCHHKNKLHFKMYLRSKLFF